MQDDPTVATSTPAEDDSVRASLEAALGEWDKAPTETGDVTEDVVSSDRPRDEKGRFIKAEDPADPEFGKEKTEEEVRAKWEDEPEKKEKPQQEVKPEDVSEQAASEQDQGETDSTPKLVEGKPPPGWTIKSKAAWDNLPDHIRADIVKREEEVNNGFAKLQRYKGLDQYVDMAQSSGTTLEAALQNYVGMEQALRRNPMEGFLLIAQNIGISPQQLGQMFGAAPAQQQNQSHQNGQGQNGASGYQDLSSGDLDDPYVRAAVQQALGPVAQKLSSLESYLQSNYEADQNRRVSDAQKVVDEFTASPEYRYFSDVEGTINQLFESGMVQRTGDYRHDLKTAYDMACQLNAEVREALINDRLSKANAERQAQAEKAAAEKRARAEAAERAAVSVNGAPTGTASMPNAGSKGSVREDLLAAWDAYT